MRHRSARRPDRRGTAGSITRQGDHRARMSSAQTLPRMVAGPTRSPRMWGVETLVRAGILLTASVSSPHAEVKQYQIAPHLGEPRLLVQPHVRAALDWRTWGGVDSDEPGEY